MGSVHGLPAATSWPPTGERRDSWWRRPGIGLLIALGLLAAVVFARVTPPIVTTADLAVTELYTQLAADGRLLLGPYSRFGWHHPGPLYFFLQAPLYALAGNRAAALFAGALAINVAALVTLAVVGARRTRGPLLALSTGACVLLAWRAPGLLASPWTAHVPILPGLTFVVLCAAVMSGSPRLLPVTVIVASLMAQSHVGFVPTVGALAVMVLVAVLLSRGPGRSPWPPFAACSALGLVLWLPSLIEALLHQGGNAAALWRFFVTGAGPGHTWGEALGNWSHGLTGVMRAGSDLPWGGHFVLEDLEWAVPCAIGQVVLLGVIARRDLRAGRRFDGSLALSNFVASCIGLWALTRIRGDILDHEIFWLTALGALNLAVIGAAGLRALAPAWVGRWPGRERAAVVAGGLVLAVGLGTGVRDLRALTSFELRHPQTSVLRAHEAIRTYVRGHGIRRPLICVGRGAWSRAAGVVLRLEQEGMPFAVEHARLAMFTPAFAATGAEDAIVVIGDPEAHRRMTGRPGNVVLFRSGRLSVDATATASAGCP